MTDNSTDTTAPEGMMPILVTTVHRGVFFGYVPKNTDLAAPTLALTRARFCIYWSQAMRGVFGLASDGPNAQCRIGPAADITLRDITSVATVTPAAAERWEAAPWS